MDWEAIYVVHLNASTSAWRGLLDFTAFERTRNSTPLQSLTTMAIIALDCPIAASTLNLIVLVASLDQKQVF